MLGAGGARVLQVAVERLRPPDLAAPTSPEPVPVPDARQAAGPAALPAAFGRPVDGAAVLPVRVEAPVAAVAVGRRQDARLRRGAALRPVPG